MYTYFVSIQPTSEYPDAQVSFLRAASAEVAALMLADDVAGHLPSSGAIL